jgi:hypothetical protein
MGLLARTSSMRSDGNLRPAKPAGPCRRHPRSMLHWTRSSGVPSRPKTLKSTSSPGTLSGSAVGPSSPSPTPTSATRLSISRYNNNADDKKQVLRIGERFLYPAGQQKTRPRAGRNQPLRSGCLPPGFVSVKSLFLTPALQTRDLQFEGGGT